MLWLGWCFRQAGLVYRLPEVARSGWGTFYKRLRRDHPGVQYVAVETAPGVLDVFLDAPVAGAEQLTPEAAETLFSAAIRAARPVRRRVLLSRGWAFPVEEKDQAGDQAEAAGEGPEGAAGRPGAAENWEVLWTGRRNIGRVIAALKVASIPFEEVKGEAPSLHGDLPAGMDADDFISLVFGEARPQEAMAGDYDELKAAAVTWIPPPFVETF